RTYFATQGGGTARQIGSSDQYAWIEPAPGIGAKPGDLVPQEWDVIEPFDSETNRIVPPPNFIFDDEDEEFYN
ncbi:MAG: hypothetical protein WC497_06315, partial [Patescibacteria group bacterium]